MKGALRAISKAIAPLSGSAKRPIEAAAAAGLCAVLAVAATARAVGLDSALWYDEITTLLRFVRLPVGDLVSNFSSLNNHPFYSLAAKASVAAFGESAVSLRAPAALFGIASIAAFLPVARRVLDARLALLALVLLAISYHHVWFSQNARGYTALLFWTTLATVLFLAGAKSKSFRIWAAYGVVFAAAMYTHLSAIFFFAAHGAIYAAFVANRFILRRAPPHPLASMAPFFGLALGLALSMFAYMPMFGDMGGAFSDVTSGAANATLRQWTDPAYVARNLLAQFLDLGPLMDIALPPAIVLAAFGAYTIWKKEKLIAAVYILPIPITVVALDVAGMRIWPRYFFVEISFLYLALVVGVAAAASAIGGYLERAGNIQGATASLTAAATTAMVIGSLPLLAKNYQSPKQDLAGAVAAVERAAAPTDLRTVYGVAAPPVIEYYAPAWVEFSPAMINGGSGGRAVWTIVAFRDQAKAKDPSAWRRFEANFSLQEKLPGTLGDGAVYVYRSNAPPEASQRSE